MYVAIYVNKADANGAEIEGFDVPDNAKASEYFDLAILGSQDLLMRIFGLADDQWFAQVGADFATTGVSDLTANQKAKAILALYRWYTMDLVQAGKMTRQRALESDVQRPPDEDFTDVDLGA
jgi:hypothetical protein